MAIIKWNPGLSVNVAQIDEEHKKLIGMINNLHDAMKQGQGSTVLATIINDLIDYTANHFKTEEDYFDQFDYPEAEAHKQQHADFVKKVTKFKEDYLNDKLTLSIDVMSFLSDWLKTHIMGTDKKYSKLFNEKGLH